VSSPETRYAKSGGVNIAYQIVGDGPFDLVLVPGFVSHLELDWEEPGSAHFLHRLASFSRLIRFDKRGTGLSDRPAGLPDLETRMEDVHAVMDAAESERAALFGYSEGGPMCVLYGSYAKRHGPDQDYPWAPTRAEREEYAERIERDWGWEADAQRMCPGADEAFARWWAARARAAASPGAAGALIRMNSAIDVRAILPAISVPTLVLHRTGDRDSRVEEGRYIASHVEGARFVELAGDDHMPTLDPDQVVDEIEEFLTGARPAPDPDRVLATVLFTDLVGSTERAGELGDQRWAELLARHHVAVRRELQRFRGREIDTAGDGFLATFDGPARAVRCAVAVREALHGLGLEMRAGVHTGECELLGEKVAGIAVHTGARVAGMAAPGEVLVSATVRDLVSGSGLAFQDRGAHALKGVGERRIYAVSDV
jgi:class 3 adenylate cyclase